MAIGWTQVLYSDKKVLDPDLYDALRCLGDMSADIRDYLTPSKLNTRLGQKHAKDGSMMSELWVYRNIDPGVPALALALDLSLNREIPNDKDSKPRRNRWIVTLGIRNNSGLAPNRIKNIVKEKLKDEQKTGKEFSLLWHASKATAQEEYKPDAHEADSVLREMLDRETDATIKLTKPRLAGSPGMPEVITRNELKTQGRPSEDAYAHYDAHLQNTGGVRKLRVIDFIVE